MKHIPLGPPTIIRDNECFGIMMIPLFHQWNVRRCNFKGCTEKPTTIINYLTDDKIPMYGLCEEHFQMGNVPDGCRMELEFDSFDAFTKVTS